MIFSNDSEEPRRLVLEYAQRVDGEEVPAIKCTTLVEDGGSQVMTFEIDLPSAAYGPFQFVVPGVDGQAIEVVVP